MKMNLPRLEVEKANSQHLPKKICLKTTNPRHPEAKPAHEDPEDVAKLQSLPRDQEPHQEEEEARR